MFALYLEDLTLDHIFVTKQVEEARAPIQILPPRLKSLQDYLGQISSESNEWKDLHLARKNRLVRTFEWLLGHNCQFLPRHGWIFADVIIVVQATDEFHVNACLMLLRLVECCFILLTG